MLDRSSAPYWFPAKRRGWGWGAPATWQGWAVLVAFVVLLAGCAIRFPPSSHTIEFVASVAVLCAVLTAICFAKGEPPRWRWDR